MEGLSEAPLPQEWDKQVFTPQTSYKKRIEYAVSKAKKLGKGSSRTAFDINFDGRPTVLKVAHNAKGMVQNEEEANILSDPYISNIVIPIIDYDEEHEQPVWIHTEKATKITAAQLCKIMKCGTLDFLISFTNSRVSSKKDWYYNSAIEHINHLSDQDKEIFYEYSDMLLELHYNNVNLSDFRRAANWGLYNGHPIVIDVGFTNEIHKQYYNK